MELYSIFQERDKQLNKNYYEFETVKEIVCKRKKSVQ